MKPLKISKQITVRETKSFTRYLQELSKMDVGKNLTIEEEMRLSDLIKQGDKKAEDELVERNLKFVVSVAKQYMYEGCSLEDMINEGNYGLIKAAKKFDADKGFKFITYAVWWIRQSILSYLNESAKTIRIPLNKISSLKKVNDIIKDFFQEFQRTPTIDEISELVNYELDKNDIQLLLTFDHNTQSISSKISKDESSDSLTIEDTLTDSDMFVIDKQVNIDDLRIEIQRSLKRMPENHKFVIEQYYGLTGGEPMTLDEIGEILGLTRERIRQIRNKALETLNQYKNSKNLRKYV